MAEELPGRSPRSIFSLACIAVALAVVVVALGALTRLMDAGLGCPDWPGCYSHIGVPSSASELEAAAAAFPWAPVEADKAWLEMVHRYAATALGLVIFGILAMALRHRLPWRLPTALAALVVGQGAFGAWTVTLRLWPQVVTAHLLGGFATLAALWWLALALRRPAWQAASRHRPLAVAAVAVVGLQVALGGWLTANYAALACPDFPTCHGQWLPPLDFAAGFDLVQAVGPNYLGGLLDSNARVTIHFAHRIGAVAVLLVVGALAWQLGRRPLAWVLGGVLAAQLALGVANVLLALPLPVAVLHNAGAAALLLALLCVVYATRRCQPAAAMTDADAKRAAARPPGGRCG